MDELLQKLLGLAVASALSTEKLGLAAGVASVPEGVTLKSLEQFQLHPARVRDTVTLSNVGDYIGYLNRFKNADSTVFITPTLASLNKESVIATAVIDYHEATEGGIPEANWGDHVVKMSARAGQAYQKLIDLDGKLLDQSEFAKHMEELARFSTSHAAADLIEIARSLALASKGEYKTVDDELSGSVDFVYNVQVKANAGSVDKPLSVPSQIDFTIPLIDGLAETLVPVKFLYRVPGEAGGKVQLGFRIIDRVWLEKAAVEAVAGTVAEETGLMVLIGTLSGKRDL